VFIVKSATPLSSNIVTQDASAIVAGESPNRVSAETRTDRDIHRYPPKQTGGPVERPRRRRTGDVIGPISLGSEWPGKGRPCDRDDDRVVPSAAVSKSD
jgi:hypothetical protein